MARSAPFCWVALDGLLQTERETLSLARKLDQKVPENGWGFKVNADWIYSVGFKNAPLVQLPGRPVFIDLKQWFGARTMSEILEMCWAAGATATNIYALAGARNPSDEHPTKKGELARAINTFRTSHPRSDMRIYTVSILTHYGEAYVRCHFGRSLAEEITILAQETRDAGASGFIMPGTQLRHADTLHCLDGLLKVIPGSRWENFSDDRHEQEMHPAAVCGRADVELVCGSPITKSADPVGQLKSLLSLVT